MIMRGEVDPYDFRHVQDDNGGLKSDTETSNHTTANNKSERITTHTREHLDHDTGDVDAATKDDSPFSANSLRDITSDDCTEESPSRQDRDDERRVWGGELVGTCSLDLVDEVGRANHTVDVSRIIPEEDTTERCERAEKVGLPGDGSLNAIDIARGVGS